MPSQSKAITWQSDESNGMTLRYEYACTIHATNDFFSTRHLLFQTPVHLLGNQPIVISIRLEHLTGWQKILSCSIRLHLLPPYNEICNIDDIIMEITELANLCCRTWEGNPWARRIVGLFRSPSSTQNHLFRGWQALCSLYQLYCTTWTSNFNTNSTWVISPQNVHIFT